MEVNLPESGGMVPESANAGNVHGQYNLGRMYEMDEGNEEYYFGETVV